MDRVATIARGKQDATRDYSPDHSPGVVLVRHAPGTAPVLAHEGLVIVIHAVGASTVIAFPARRIVVIVAGVVGYAMLLAVTGDIAVNGGAAVVTVADIAAVGIAIVVAAAAIIAITAACVAITEA